MGEGVSLKPPNNITEYSCLNGSTHAGIQGCNNERNFFSVKNIYINLLITGWPQGFLKKSVHFRAC